MPRVAAAARKRPVAVAWALASTSDRTGEASVPGNYWEPLPCSINPACTALQATELATSWTRRTPNEAGKKKNRATGFEEEATSSTVAAVLLQNLLCYYCFSPCNCRSIDSVVCAVRVQLYPAGEGARPTLTAGLGGAAAGEAAGLVPHLTTRRSPLLLPRLAWHVRRLSRSPPSSLRKLLCAHLSSFGGPSERPCCPRASTFHSFFSLVCFCRNPIE